VEANRGLAHTLRPVFTWDKREETHISVKQINPQQHSAIYKRHAKCTKRILGTTITGVRKE
jgi:hypothetical protein